MLWSLFYKILLGNTLSHVLTLSCNTQAGMSRVSTDTVYETSSLLTGSAEVQDHQTHSPEANIDWFISIINWKTGFVIGTCVCSSSTRMNKIKIKKTYCNCLSACSQLRLPSGLVCIWRRRLHAWNIAQESG